MTGQRKTPGGGWIRTGALGYCVTERSVVITDANTSVAAAALNYARAGFAVIPLHGVGADGGCTCKEWREHHSADHAPGGKQTGKHPVRGQWTKGAALSTADAHAVWNEESPWANVGIRTGVVSGFWVLDVDPAAGGFESLAKLLAHTGPLETFTVRTGGGGLHYWFACPDFPVTNGSNREIKKLFGPGLDIRGDGGQVVAPPSVSGRGAYTIAASLPIGSGPAKLLELLTDRSGHQAAREISTHVVEDLPFSADLPESERVRVERYARSVLEAEAQTYRNAVPGTGNETLFTAACNVLEIAQSPWNLVTAQEGFEKLDAARLVRNASHPYRGGQDELEFAKTWASAQNRVVGQGRALPVAPDAGLGFDPSPFSHGPAGPGLSSYPPIVAPGASALPSATNSDLFAAPGTEASSNTSGPGAQGNPAAIAPSGQPVSILDQIRARTLGLDELAGLTPPTPLIEGVLDEQTLAVLAGQFGTFKTFIALDWLLCIATGTPWLGHAVPRARPVRLVVGEGVAGLYGRVKAWEKGKGVTVPPDMFKAVRGAVNLGQVEQVMAVAELARERGEAVIAFDTLARCSVGLEENKASDQARVTDAAGWIREHAGATTLLLHHAGHGGERARGSSAIEDNADTSWFASLTSDQNRHHSRPRKLECRKMKDAELTGDILVRFEQDDDRDHGGTGSGWLTASNQAGARVDIIEGIPFSSPGPQFGVFALDDPLLLTEGVATVAQVFLDVFREGNGGTQAQVWSIASQGRYRMAKSTFYAAWNRLIEKGAIRQVHGRNTFRYLTPEEREKDA